MLRIAPIRNPTKTYADGWEVGTYLGFIVYFETFIVVGIVSSVTA